MGARCVLETSVPRTRRIFVHVNKKCLKDVILFLKKEGFAHLSAITGLEVNGAIELLYHFMHALRGHQHVAVNQQVCILSVQRHNGELRQPIFQYRIHYTTRYSDGRAKAI